MKKRWSSLSKPDCHADHLIGDTRTPFIVKDKNGIAIGCDKWENEYGTRSTVNDETLKKKHIVCVGDSFVYGHGVARGNTISDYFDNITSDDYSCFNLGEPGTGFDTALLRLQQWCNEFGDNVHTIYFGLSAITRWRHWEFTNKNWQWEDDVYTEENYDGVFHDYFKVDFLDIRGPSEAESSHKRSNYIRKSYAQLLSKVHIFAKLDATIMAVINLSKVYNFNVYFFNTNAKNYTIKDGQVLKEQTESHQVKWCTGFQFDPVMIEWTRVQESLKGDEKRKNVVWDINYIPNDGHWNSKGCNLVAKLLYEETKQWY